MREASGLDPVLHQPQRLRIMAALHRNRQLAFPALRDDLGLTPGNLGAHLARLEAAGYVASARILVGVHFEARYRITPEGSDAFRRYVATLRAMLEAMEEIPDPVPRDPAPDVRGHLS